MTTIGPVEALGIILAIFAGFGVAAYLFARIAFAGEE
jgi:hypothetical protein